MIQPISLTPNPKLDLVLERVIDVPRELVWEAWTNPEMLKQWFVPAPWTITECDVDLRPGGKFLVVMRSPDGEEHPNAGCYLEIIPGERLVWTDALLPGFRPSPIAFMTGVISLKSEGTGTRYTAMAMHKDEETRRKHEEMGFQSGWGTVLDQMVALIKAGQK